jgi:outer membrane lipoprotein-sorting protein
MKKLGIQADETGRVRLMIIFDKSGNTTEISFSDIQEGTGIGDQLFVFRAPKGAEIIEQ